MKMSARLFKTAVLGATGYSGLDPRGFFCDILVWKNRLCFGARRTLGARRIWQTCFRFSPATVGIRCRRSRGPR